ncbi:MAG: hypothetical protein R2747_18885 [Pyrinomonadaceae bacterium]
MFAQKSETFDIITFQTPNGWQKQVQQSAVQIGAEDANGGVCLITIFKSIPGNNDSKVNFNAAWEAAVKEVVTVKSAPNMNPPGNENGWMVESGSAQYESDGQKGAVILITATGDGKMINFLIMTNTDAFQSDIDQFIGSVQLPKISSRNPASNPPNTTSSPSAFKSRFTYSTTNFDDGWVSREDEYWVETVKGNVKVYLYYFFNLGADMRPPNGNIRDNLWQKMIAKRYKILNENESRRTPYTGELKEGEAIDNATGQKVYLTMVWRGNLILAVTPNQQESNRLFPDENSLARMNDYNKFAVGEKDLTGTWQDGATNTQDWYDSVTGNYAGMTFASKTAVFNFYGNGTYSSVHNGATGRVGNMSSFQQEYKGKYSVSNWSLTATNRWQGKTEVFNASFQAVKGGRLLILNNTDISYTLVKIK